MSQLRELQRVAARLALEKVELRQQLHRLLLERRSREQLWSSLSQITGLPPDQPPSHLPQHLANLMEELALLRRRSEHLEWLEFVQR